MTAATVPASVKVFIGWSGQRSRAVATAFAEWLPDALHAVEPWISEEMERGAQWFATIGANLKSANYGLLCVTPENAGEPWVLFEAGALAMSTSERLACPYLLDLTPADLKAPLAQLQAAKAEKDDTWRVLQTINGLLDADRRLSETRLQRSFGRVWPELESKLADALKIPVAAPPKPQRSRDDKIDEVLTIVRDLQRVGVRDLNTMASVLGVAPNYTALDEALKKIGLVPVPSTSAVPSPGARGGLLDLLREAGQQPETATLDPSTGPTKVKRRSLRELTGEPSKPDPST
ncbi:MAG: TIR domain-containing protein [Gemmatimonadales bacterium]|nr:TIR domain-containing protein [Gemmatimonadales bacterium]